MLLGSLTEKQKAWIDFYKQGKTGAEAARLAGYKAGSDNAFQSIGSENLRKLAAYVADRDAVLEKPRIADMEEINEFWSEIIRSAGEKTADRIKASELRARSMGAFVDRVEQTTVAMSLEEYLLTLEGEHGD